MLLNYKSLLFLILVEVQNVILEQIIIIIITGIISATTTIINIVITSDDDDGDDDDDSIYIATYLSCFVFIYILTFH